MRTVWREY